MIAAAVLGASAPVLADGRVDGPEHPIVVTTPGERSSHNLQFIAGLTGVGLVLTGLGAFYNLDSRSESNRLTAEAPTGQPWTAGDQAEYDDAHRLARDAVICYSLGGLVLISALVSWIATAPDDQYVTVQPHAQPTLTPTPGGALLGGSWRF